MDMSRGYEIKPASEGGFVVCGKPAVTPWGAPPGVTETPATVAFSNAKDLIVWLANSHEVSIAVNEIGVAPMTAGPFSYGPWMSHDGSNVNPVEDRSQVIQADMGQGCYGSGMPNEVIRPNVIAYRKILRATEKPVVLSVDEPLSPAIVEAIQREAQETVTKMVREHDQRRS